MSNSPRSPYFDADLAASENLINCYLREGGEFSPIDSSHLYLELKRTKKRIVACYSDRMTLGDLRLKNLAGVEHAQSDEPTRLKPSELAELLALELQGDTPLHPERTSDWKENLESSTVVSDLILANRKASDVEQEITNFIASEQSLTIGHRFHPSPKSRIGFSQDELRKYSPEFKPSFQLRYFSVKRQSGFVRGSETELESWNQRVRSFLTIDDGFYILPVHPWQAALAHKEPMFQAAIKAGDVIDHGICGPQFYPTASVRTLYQPDWDLFLKTSLDVRITNCFRPNLKPEMEAAIKINDVVESQDLETETFRIFRENLCLDVSDKMNVHLGVIFRNGFQKTVGTSNSRVLLAASLFGDRNFSTQRLDLLIGRSQDAIKTWFATYCHLIVPPLLTLFWQDGLMLEPHLQNVLIEFEANQPKRILLRDLDNAKLIAGGKLAAQTQDVEATYDLETGWKRLTYCLFVNHLAEAISSLASLDTNPRALETKLWTILHDVLKNPEVPTEARERLFNDPHLWVKKNFFTRIVRGDDLKAPFAPVLNPLAKQNS